MSGKGRSNAWRVLWSTVLAGAGPTLAVAQDDAAVRGSVDAGELPTGHPPVNDASTADPEMPTGHQEIMDRFRGRVPPIATAEETPSVSTGSIAVTVVDPAGRPVSNQAVELAIMESMGSRRRQECTTDPSGQCSFRDLVTGSAQSYRVNVSYAGAKYSSTPFRLTNESGYAVRVRRLPTTDQSEFVLQQYTEVRLEFVAERLRVVQVVDLVNPTDRTYVFPEEGLYQDLPENFVNFQFQSVMSDQRLEATERGFRFRGSLPPGRVQLIWAFDLPVTGEELDFSVPVPFRSIGMVGVIAEAAAEMRLDVRGLPEAQVRQLESTRALVTQMQRSVQDPPLESLAISLRGIPGPGPYRWFALVGAGLFVLVALLSTRPRTSVQGASEYWRQRRAALLEDAADLARLHAAEEIGPKYYQRQIEQVEIELAAILKAERDSPSSSSGEPESGEPDKSAR